MPDEEREVRFACDAMLGGLARWLRAAGYDALWRPDIDDWELIRTAHRENRILLSSDSGIFKIGVIRDALVPALYIPHGYSKLAQLEFVVKKFKLTRGMPHCMACGGELETVPKSDVAHRAPPRTYAWLDEFFECKRCKQLFWKGTHWKRISASLTRAYSKL